MDSTVCVSVSVEWRRVRECVRARERAKGKKEKLMNLPVCATRRVWNERSRDDRVPPHHSNRFPPPHKLDPTDRAVDAYCVLNRITHA